MMSSRSSGTEIANGKLCGRAGRWRTLMNKLLYAGRIHAGTEKMIDLGS
jgi:hypothetical protein